jgi:hypothetical protein
MSNTAAIAIPVVQEEGPKKRGRRKKIVQEVEATPTPKTSSKKGGSKKITDMNELMKMDMGTKSTNTILYLKCHIQDIDQYIQDQKWKTDNFTYDPKVPYDFVPFSYEQSTKPIGYALESDTVLNGSILKEESSRSLDPSSSMVCSICAQKSFGSTNIGLLGAHHTSHSLKPGMEKSELEEEELQKIKDLKFSFYKNHIPDKKVDCFWCTYPFDNDPYYVLQHGSDQEILAHGSFCTPECGVAYLFGNMNWDDSAKVDSYRLMNHFYGSNDASSKNQNIKPACSPFYFLEKYYGNMTIQEYRRLSKSSNVMLCIDKPVTRLLPEIHEDNEKQFMNGTATQHRGNYKVKKQSEKVAGPSRNSILRDSFRGVTTAIAQN